MSTIIYAQNNIYINYNLIFLVSAMLCVTAWWLIRFLFYKLGNTVYCIGTVYIVRRKSENFHIICTRYVVRCNDNTVNRYYNIFERWAEILANNSRSIIFRFLLNVCHDRTAQNDDVQHAEGFKNRCFQRSTKNAFSTAVHSAISI